MKIIPSAIVILLICAAPTLCQEIPTDVPQDHYAYSAIQDLVDRGINVSQGYPDGLFHGNKKTDRYETAYLMAKLALSFKEGVPTSEIDVSDVEEEISYLRSDINDVKHMPELQNDFRYYGSLDLLSRFGGVIAYEQDHRVELGPETSYRFQYTVEKQMGDDALIKMDIDTMDGGFNTMATREFPTQIMDFEGDLAVDLGLENQVNITALFGPGSVLHRDTSGVDPSEDYTYFSRPRPTLKVATVLGGYDVSSSYVARDVSSFGDVGTSELNLQFGRDIAESPLFGTVEVDSVTRYVFVELFSPSFGPNDLREELSFTGRVSDSFWQQIIFGISGTDTYNNNLYLNYEMHLINGNDSIDFLFNSVGTNYRLPFEALEFVPLNLFDRKILNGNVDVGLNIGHQLSDSLQLTCRTEYMMDSHWKMGKDIPGSSFTQELALDYGLSKDLTLSMYYRYYYVPSRVAQFGVAVPEVSDVFGLGFRYKF